MVDRRTRHRLNLVKTDTNVIVELDGIYIAKRSLPQVPLSTWEPLDRHYEVGISEDPSSIWIKRNGVQIYG